MCSPDRRSAASLLRGASARHGERSSGQDRRTHRDPAWSDSGSAVFGLARLTSAKGRHDPRQGRRARASAFQKKELEPRLEEATDGKRIVYFVDAAHFVLAPFLGYLWTRLRRFIRAPSGRQRFNVLGALNAVTHQLLTVTNDSYINSQSEIGRAPV